MKRYIMPILALVLITSLLPVFGCRGQESISEKQVIEMTHDYLMDRAEELQGSRAFLTKGQINWGFRSTVLNAWREAVLSDAGAGKSVEISLDGREPLLEASYKTPTSSNALKMLAQDEGNGLWAVSIGEWELEFNERTNEVKARNNEAAKLLEEITLRTYHNTKYGYSINYPPKWNVLDILKEGVSISSVSADGTMVRAIFLNCLPMIPSLSLRDYAEQRVESFRHDSYQIDMAEGNPTVGGIVADIVAFRFDDLFGKNTYDAKWYFIEKDDKVYEILTIAWPLPDIMNKADLFDPYPSFRFQP